MEISTSFSSTALAIGLVSLVLIVVLCLLIYELRRNTLLLKRLSQSADSHRDASALGKNFFNAEKAEKWFEKGEINRLTKYCEKFIKDTPNSVYANWYCGLGYYNQGEYEIARDYFEKVILINPLWREGAVVYLQEIANKIGLPTSPTLH